MTLQLLHSEFPYIWGKFDFLFYQCTSWLGWGWPDWRWRGSSHKIIYVQKSCACATHVIKPTTYQLTWVRLAGLAVERQLTKDYSSAEKLHMRNTCHQANHLQVDLDKVGRIDGGEVAYTRLFMSRKAVHARHMESSQPPTSWPGWGWRVGCGEAAHKFNQCSEKLLTRHMWYKARHLPVDLGDVGGVGRGEATHKFNQCAQYLVYQVRHLPVDLGEVGGVGCVQAAHKEVGPLHHRAIHDVCAHYWCICKTKHRYFLLVFFKYSLRWRYRFSSGN